MIVFPAAAPAPPVTLQYGGTETHHPTPRTVALRPGRARRRAPHHFAGHEPGSPADVACQDRHPAAPADTTALGSSSLAAASSTSQIMRPCSGWTSWMGL